jgi:hypothetical protein
VLTEPSRRKAWFGQTTIEPRQRIVEDGIVRYELTPEGDGTLLVFTHRGLSRKNAEGFAPGEYAFLNRLDALLAAARCPLGMTATPS